MQAYEEVRRVTAAQIDDVQVEGDFVLVIFGSPNPPIQFTRDWASRTGPAPGSWLVVDGSGYRVISDEEFKKHFRVPQPSVAEMLGVRKPVLKPDEQTPPFAKPREDGMCGQQKIGGNLPLAAAQAPTPPSEYDTVLLDFSQAFRQLTLGYRIRRLSWIGQGYLHLGGDGVSLRFASAELFSSDHVLQNAELFAQDWQASNAKYAIGIEKPPTQSIAAQGFKGIPKFGAVG